MEDVIGGRADPAKFDAYLADWRTVLARRTAAAVAALSEVSGVCGLILAGSLGRGDEWPLSDIDLLPIYNGAIDGDAAAEVERRRMALQSEWLRQGWWTGLDIGRLAFTQEELRQALEGDDLTVAALLQDDRWYHSVDKGYQGRAVFDTARVADALTEWLTAHRFSPAVVRLRMEREEQEIADAMDRLGDAEIKADPLGVAVESRLVVKWVQTWLLESWGERDNSLGRFGTRFERSAHAHGMTDLITKLNSVSSLDEGSVRRRMSAAPAWVWERHDRSWRSRRLIGEEVLRDQDARDVLRVCSHYALQKHPSPTYPEWLAVPTERQTMAILFTILRSVVEPLLECGVAKTDG